MNYFGIFAFLTGLILLYAILFPKSKLFFLPPVIFSFQILEEDLYFLPLLSVSAFIIYRYFKREEGLSFFNLFFALLPAIFFLLNSSEGYIPIFPFPSSLKEISAPFPVFLSILIVLLRGNFFLKFLSLCLFLTFILPSLKIPFNLLLFLITMSGIKFLEEEIIKGEGQFFSNLMRWMWRAIKTIFFIFLFSLIFAPSEHITLDLIYVLLSLLFFEIGFLLKSATILVRHKVYFSVIGFFLSTITYFSFV